jgi:hypothetical protein
MVNNSTDTIPPATCTHANADKDDTSIRQATPSSCIVSIAYEDLVKQSTTMTRWMEEKKPVTKHGSHILQVIERAFGSHAQNDNTLGFLLVTNVPQVEQARRQLLPMAAQLANLPSEDLCALEQPEALYSVGWSHGKEQLRVSSSTNESVADTGKGSFYANPRVNDLVQALKERDPHEVYEEQAQMHPSFYAPNIWPTKSLPELKPAFQSLGHIMAETGYHVAALCDTYCAQYNVHLGLRNTLRQSLNQKGRLLHYFAINDTDVQNSSKQDIDSQQQETPMWCGWHNDHVSTTEPIDVVDNQLLFS